MGCEVLPEILAAFRNKDPTIDLELALSNRPDVFRFKLEIWLAMHEDLRATRRIRLSFDHLAEGLEHYVR